MSQRNLRVNQLLRLELSEHLRKRHRDAAVLITISEVDASPDFRSARVYYSVLGDAAAVHEAAHFFDRYGKQIQQEVAKRVILKFFPRFEYVYDPSLARGAEVIALLDSLEEDSGPSPRGVRKPGNDE